MKIKVTIQPVKGKIPAVSNDTKGGKSAMSEMNPQKPDAMKPKMFRGVFDNC